MKKIGIIGGMILGISIIFLGLSACGTRQETAPWWFTSWADGKHLHVIISREKLESHIGFGPSGFASREETITRELVLFSWDLENSTAPTIAPLGRERGEDLAYRDYVSVAGDGVWSVAHQGRNLQFHRLDKMEDDLIVDNVIGHSPSYSQVVVGTAGLTPQIFVRDVSAKTSIDVSAAIDLETKIALLDYHRSLFLDDSGHFLVIADDQYGEERAKQVSVIPLAENRLPYSLDIGISPNPRLKQIASTNRSLLLLTSQNDLRPDKSWDIPYAAILDGTGKLLARSPLTEQKTRCIMDCIYEAYVWLPSEGIILLAPKSVNYRQLPAEQQMTIWNYRSGKVTEKILKIPPEWQNQYGLP